MRKLIFVPQLPVYMRYQEWWFDEFEKQFQKHFKVITLGKPFLRNKTFTPLDDHLFSSVERSIELEQYQINQYLELDIQNDDVLFLADISFPGFFSNILHHKTIRNAFAFCHGTSLNNWDYFRGVRDSKSLVEKGHAALFKKVFVATNYHKNKLGWNNLEVIGAPKQPFKDYLYEKKSKIYNIISVARDTHQKRSAGLEDKIEDRFGHIQRMKFLSWKFYYQTLASSKIMLITSKEETFGYQVLDAISNGCVPLAPNNFSYPELLPRKYLYDNEKELFEKVEYYLEHPFEYPKQLLNQSMVDNFYSNLINNFIINQ